MGQRCQRQATPRSPDDGWNAATSPMWLRISPREDNGAQHQCTAQEEWDDYVLALLFFVVVFFSFRRDRETRLKGQWWSLLWAGCQCEVCVAMHLCEGVFWEAEWEHGAANTIIDMPEAALLFDLFWHISNCDGNTVSTAVPQLATGGAVTASLPAFGNCHIIPKCLYLLILKHSMELKRINTKKKCTKH